MKIIESIFFTVVLKDRWGFFCWYYNLQIQILNSGVMTDKTCFAPVTQMLRRSLYLDSKLSKQTAHMLSVCFNENTSALVWPHAYKPAQVCNANKAK